MRRLANSAIDSSRITATWKFSTVVLNYPERSLRICWTMRSKDEQIGFRLPANLKRELHNLARREGRTLSQICEICVSGGLESYRREGPKYLQRLLSRQKKEGTSE